MNIEEGAKRMRQAGMGIAMIPTVSAMALIVRAAVYTSYRLGGDSLEPSVLDLLTLAVPGFLLWLAGWIVDGFARDAR